MGYRRISPALRQQIIDLFDEGAEYSEIREATGAKQPTIYRVLKASGRRRKTMTYISDETRQDIVTLRQEGKPHREIAESTGLHRVTVGKKLRKAGYKTEMKQVTADVIKTIVELRSKNFSYAAISKRVGFSSNAIMYALIDHANEIVMITASGRPQVSPEEFIVAWQESSSLQEVSLRLGMRAAAVYARARNYRERGISLKTYKHARYQWEDVARFAEMIVKKSEKKRR